MLIAASLVVVCDRDRLQFDSVYEQCVPSGYTMSTPSKMS